VLPGRVRLGGVFCTNEFALPEGRWEGGREKRHGALGSEMVEWDFKCAYEYGTFLSIRYVANNIWQCSCFYLKQKSSVLYSDKEYDWPPAAAAGRVCYFPSSSCTTSDGAGGSPRLGPLSKRRTTHFRPNAGNSHKQRDPACFHVH
jgi:hypothetical protein